MKIKGDKNTHKHLFICLMWLRANSFKTHKNITFPAHGIFEANSFMACRAHAA